LEVYEHSKLLVDIRTQKISLDSNLKEYESQKEWLLSNKLPPATLLQMKRQIEADKKKLINDINECEKQNINNGIKWGVHISDPNALNYSHKVIDNNQQINFNYPHSSLPAPNNKKLVIKTILMPFEKKHGNLENLNSELKS
jgi:hypothetical protein